MKRSGQLGVLIPTRNSASLLPAHLAALAQWIDLAEEIIVVDSYSTDGTLELLREGLRGRPARFISHPPGLYASWNAGIREISARFTYISTIGDTVTRAGLEGLLAAAESLNADVAIGKPGFKRPDGAEVQVRWPVDEVIELLGITAPRLLSATEAILFAVSNPRAALTGSCASDVFRTSVLQRFPFPTNFGTGGDGIWGLQHAPLVSWAVVPERCSTFLLHSTARSQAENAPAPGAPGLDQVLTEAAERWQKAGVVQAGDLEALRWPDLFASVTGYLAAKGEFDRRRKQAWPWILNPAAWAVRQRRGRFEAQVARLKTDFVERQRSRSPQSPGTPPARRATA